MSSPQLSIIIPTSKGVVPQSLIMSIKEQSLDSNLYEVLLVFNKIIPKPWPKNNDSLIKFLVSTPTGVNYARNLGMQHALGSVFYFIDDDCKLTDKKFLENIISAHEKYVDQISIGGPYTLPEHPSNLDRSYFLLSHNWLKAHRLAPFKSNALLGGNASYKSKIYRDGLRFPPQIKYGGSETSLNAQISALSGIHRWEEELSVEHDCQLTFFSFLKKAFLQGRGSAFEEQNYGLMPQIAFTNACPSNSLIIRVYIAIYEFSFRAGKYSYTHKWSFPFLIGHYYIRIAYGHYSRSKFHRALQAILGFLRSLFEEPQSLKLLPPFQKLKQRFILFSKKWAWLFLKCMGLR